MHRPVGRPRYRGYDGPNAAVTLPTIASGTARQHNATLPAVFDPVAILELPPLHEVDAVACQHGCSHTSRRNGSKPDLQSLRFDTVTLD